MSVGTLSRVVDALEASAELMLRWRGEELDRLADSAHATMVQDCAQLLADNGWAVRVEVSFSHFGERGRVDVLALHPQSRTLVVGEVKSAIGNEQDTVGQVDMKARLGSVIAETVGWEPEVVVPALILGDAHTARRIVGEHAAAFARFNVRGRQARAWIRRPASSPSGTPTGLLWFAKLPDSRGVSVTRNSRVRTPTQRP